MTSLAFPSSPPKTRKLKDNVPQAPIDMNQVATVILGGGQGARLYPLTLTRCKPAICFGGKYRLIDVPISNSLNSGCHKIFVLTQFLSSSLHRHIFQTYPSDSFSPGFIDLLAAEQRPMKTSWYQGTADAVRQNLTYLLETPVEYFLILSGDQLYNLNFQNLLQCLIQTQSDAVIAALPVSESQIDRMGLLKINASNLIIDFHEKPQDKKIIEQMRCPSLSGDCNFLGSMGIYLFKRQTLINLLEQDPREDFGKHLIPTLIKSSKTSAFIFDGYWEDIGTIESFYNANMSLTKNKPEFNCSDEANPIFAARNHLPPPRFDNTQLRESIICEGAIIEAEEISSSILGPRSIVRKGTVIRDSYLMGNDYYSSPFTKKGEPSINYQIGEECLIQHAIIDKQVRIGNGVQLVNKRKLSQYNSNNIYIRDGIIIVTRGAELPDGFTL